MLQLAARFATAVTVAAAGTYGSHALVRYADRDDSPGGMVIGTILMFGSLGLGVWFAVRRVGQPTNRN
jgi:hypothetical protein